MTTPEQQAREMLERMGIGNAYERMSAGELVELANLIAERDALKAELERVKAERDDWGKRWHQERRKVAELRYPGMTGVVKPMAEELFAIKQERERMQARIDALMLEYCPDEMSDEQKRNWAANQVPAQQGEKT